MARGLAAICPPLTSADVRRAAEKLAVSQKPSPIIDNFLQLGADLMLGRQVVEALGALHEIAAESVASDDTLPARGIWVKRGRIQREHDSLVSDRVLQELVRVVSNSISAAAMHGVILRAMYLAEVDFPFLAPLRASSEFDAGFEDIGARLTSASPTEAGDATLAIVRNTLELLNALIGDDLTFSLTRTA